MLIVVCPVVCLWVGGCIILVMKYGRDSFRDRTFVDEFGYLRFEDTGELVHRKVAEAMLGRVLRENELVRHVNGDKLDNQDENIYVVSPRSATATVRS